MYSLPLCNNIVQRDLGLAGVPQIVSLDHCIDVIMLLDLHKQEVMPLLKALVRRTAEDGGSSTL